MKIYEIDYDELNLEGQTATIHFGHQMLVLVGDVPFTDDVRGVTEVEVTTENKRRAAAALREMSVDEDGIDEPTMDMIRELEMPTHEEYLTNALAKIDVQHAAFMKDLTGRATTEERDTWPSKVEASRFVMTADDAVVEAEVAKVLTDDPTAMDDLETLVQDVGGQVDDLRALATTVLAKSRAFKRLIGVASKFRREARAAVTAATDTSVPIEQVGAQLDAVEAALTGQIESTIAALNAG